jgi:hypothetical protein
MPRAGPSRSQKNLGRYQPEPSQTQRAGRSQRHRQDEDVDDEDVTMDIRGEDDREDNNGSVGRFLVTFVR